VFFNSTWHQQSQFDENRTKRIDGVTIDIKALSPLLVVAVAALVNKART
jgi:hypothetical protein